MTLLLYTLLLISTVPLSWSWWSNYNYRGISETKYYTSLSVKVEQTPPGRYAAVTFKPGGALFGPQVTGSIVGTAGLATPADACTEIQNNTVQGKIALTMRGECTFQSKVRNAERAGAVAVIIIDRSNSSGWTINLMSGDGEDDVNISSVFLHWEDGTRLLQMLSDPVTLVVELGGLEPDCTELPYWWRNTVTDAAFPIPYQTVVSIRCIDWYTNLGDNTVTCLGGKSYTAQPTCLLNCSISNTVKTAYETPGSIQSSNYPDTYPNDVDCIFIIKAEYGQSIWLNFEVVNLGSQSSYCPNDYLEVRDGASQASPMLKKFCSYGSSSDSNVFISSGPALSIKFHTNYGAGYSGYFARYATFDKGWTPLYLDATYKSGTKTYATTDFNPLKDVIEISLTDGTENSILYNLSLDLVLGVDLYAGYRKVARLVLSYKVQTSAVGAITKRYGYLYLRLINSPYLYCSNTGNDEYVRLHGTTDQKRIIFDMTSYEVGTIDGTGVLYSKCQQSNDYWLRTMRGEEGIIGKLKMDITMGNSSTYLAKLVSLRYRIKVQGDLLSRNRPTSSNSVSYGGDSDRAVDGRTSGIWADKTCTRSYGATNNWWKVDLKATAKVYIIKIYNRLDCCEDRINGAQVFVGNALCERITYVAGQAEYVLDCGGMVGDSVKVVQNYDFLTLCEVKVYGELEDTTTTETHDQYPPTTEYPIKDSTSTSGATKVIIYASVALFITVLGIYVFYRRWENKERDRPAAVAEQRRHLYTTNYTYSPARVNAQDVEHDTRNWTSDDDSFALHLLNLLQTDGDTTNVVTTSQSNHGTTLPSETEPTGPAAPTLATPAQPTYDNLDSTFEVEQAGPSYHDIISEVSAPLVLAPYSANEDDTGGERSVLSSTDPPPPKYEELFGNTEC